MQYIQKVKSSPSNGKFWDPEKRILNFCQNPVLKGNFQDVNLFFRICFSMKNGSNGIYKTKIMR